MSLHENSSAKKWFLGEKIEWSLDFFLMYNIFADPFSFLHGAFHWVCCLYEKNFVVSFSILDEVYGEIQLLESMMKRFNHHVKYGVIVLRRIFAYLMLLFFQGRLLSTKIILTIRLLKQLLVNLQKLEPYFFSKKCTYTCFLKKKNYIYL